MVMKIAVLITNRKEQKSGGKKSRKEKFCGLKWVRDYKLLDAKCGGLRPGARVLVFDVCI